VRELVSSIRTWITNWNDDPKPFVWHKTADEILDSLSAYCERINDSGVLGSQPRSAGAGEQRSYAQRPGVKQARSVTPSGQPLSPAAETDTTFIRHP
jgi:hypothetical protein